MPRRGASQFEAKACNALMVRMPPASARTWANASRKVSNALDTASDSWRPASVRTTWRDCRKNQGKPEPLLQQLDLVAYGRLAHPQLQAGAGEAAEPGGGLERPHRR